MEQGKEPEFYPIPTKAIKLMMHTLIWVHLRKALRQKREMEKPEFPTYVGWDRKEHAEF